MRPASTSSTSGGHARPKCSLTCTAYSAWAGTIPVAFSTSQFVGWMTVSPDRGSFDRTNAVRTTVTATATGFIATTAAATQITVSAPGITLNSNGAIIGAGLQNGSWTATLGGSTHGGVTMRIASSNPAVALVSPNATTPGTAFIDVPVADLNSGANYYLQGVEGATGTVTITASAPGFTSGTGSPILKKTIALARLDVVHAALGTVVEVGKLDGKMKRIPAKVVRFSSNTQRTTRSSPSVSGTRR